MISTYRAIVPTQLRTKDLRKAQRKLARAKSRAKIRFLARCTVLHLQIGFVHVWYNPKFAKLRSSAYDIINSAA